MVERPTLGERIEYLRLALAVPMRGTVARDRFGVLVGELDQTQDGEPYAGSTVKRWEEGAMPGLSAVRAMVALGQKHGLTYVTLESLVEGSGWPAMPPRKRALTGRKLSAAEIAEARAERDRKKPAPAQPKRRAK